MSDTMTGRERLLKALKGEPTDRPSVISACQYATYELMDAVGASWPEAHRDAELMATLSGKGGAEVIGLDAIRAPYCQTIEAEALGAKIKSGGKTHIPSIAEHPYKVDDVPEFPDDFLTRGRVPVAVKAVSLMKEKYGDQVLVMGGIGGPFSIANSLIGITPFLKAMFKTPDKIQPFLEMGYQAALTFGKAYIEAGADAIVIEDMMASLDMISPKNYRQLAQPYEKKLIAELGVPVILHICGKLDKVMLDIADTGCAGISVESAVNIPAAKAAYKEKGIRLPIIGDISPSGVLLNGTPDEIKDAVHDALARGVDIISPGCAAAPSTPLANLKAMVEGAKDA
ncbi:MAG: MtaA/CmuA family methyltransferase [Veillonellaceae bacterium]|uniref:MtaA/CmuA family methyltransferase n=1 Tax=uncultured Selenomonas sp. TaxID=159275 RepID=UPI0025E9F59E|nr:MtaA/CmuA family methyltransferase [uncultured Selenomonas sp.]MCI7540973.1 MtaA/CmuA family methyltransferase [Veillonellaceae bacterium]